MKWLLIAIWASAAPLPINFRHWFGTNSYDGKAYASSEDCEREALTFKTQLQRDKDIKYSGFIYCFGVVPSESTVTVVDGEPVTKSLAPPPHNDVERLWGTSPQTPSFGWLPPVDLLRGSMEH
jgi:hypothetical protein